MKKNSYIMFLAVIMLCANVAVSYAGSLGLGVGGGSGSGKGGGTGSGGGDSTCTDQLNAKCQAIPVHGCAYAETTPNGDEDIQQGCSEADLDMQGKNPKCAPGAVGCGIIKSDCTHYDAKANMGCKEFAYKSGGDHHKPGQIFAVTGQLRCCQKRDTSGLA